jgi:hypothetical protein
MDALSAFAANNIWLLALLLVWVLPWKGVALWKAAMRDNMWWFIIIFIVNTFGILDIFYIFFIAKKRDGGEEYPMNDGNVNGGGTEWIDRGMHEDDTHPSEENSLPESDTKE